jgi:hypothetical protein
MDGDFGFGMRRLSIIDVAGGHQPITTPDGRYSIVFNGEIYNHLDLRGELADAGFTFRTRSDTETLLASFVHWQDDAWLRLEGMYAVALWDHVARTLTLARDPLGIKPLYLTQQNDGIAFASEIRALKVLPGHRFDIDERAVHDFFSFGHVQKPRSIYQQVGSLEPGTSFVPGSGRGGPPRVLAARIRVRRGRSGDRGNPRARAGDRQATHAADVPVGAFLSGVSTQRRDGGDDASDSPSHQGVHDRLSELDHRRDRRRAALRGAPWLRAHRAADAADGPGRDLSRRAALVRRTLRGHRGGAHLVPVAAGGTAREGGAVRRRRRQGAGYKRQRTAQMMAAADWR